MHLIEAEIPSALASLVDLSNVAEALGVLLVGELNARVAEFEAFWDGFNGGLVV